MSAASMSAYKQTEQPTSQNSDTLVSWSDGQTTLGNSAMGNRLLVKSRSAGFRISGCADVTLQLGIVLRIGSGIGIGF